MERKPNNSNGSRHTGVLNRRHNSFSFLFLMIKNCFLPGLLKNDAPTPSLAPNASRRGYLSFFTRKRRTYPLPRSKRESEGLPLFFSLENDVPTPSLAPNASRR